MKKTFKKIVAYVVTLAILTVIVSGVTVNAAATQFSFNLIGGNSDYITMVKQNNNMNYATVKIASISPSNTPVAIWIADSSGRKITSTMQITKTGIYKLYYLTPVSYNLSVRFCVSANHYLQISGTIEV